MFELSKIDHKINADVHYYTFLDSSHLYLEGLQFIKTSSPKPLVPCYDVRYNGLTKLVYDLRDYKRPFIDIRTMSFEQALLRLTKFSVALQQALVEHYIKKEGLSLTFDSVYEDTNGQIKLLYVPVIHNEAWDEEAVKKNMMKELISFFKEYDDAEYPFLVVLRRELMSNGDHLFKTLKRFSLVEDVIHFDGQPYYEYENTKTQGVKLKSTGQETQRNSIFSLFKKSKTGGATAEEEKIHVISLETPDAHIKFESSQESFIVGSLPQDQVDGSLQGIRGISRKHFEIVKSNHCEFWITDLYSTNGTKVNKEVIAPSVPVRIKHGDVIEVLNVKFFVKIEERAIG